MRCLLGKVCASAINVNQIYEIERLLTGYRNVTLLFDIFLLLLSKT